VTWHGVRGFVPLSQLANTGPPSDEPVETRLESRRGEMLTLKILEVNHRRNRLILSERAAEQERRAVQRDRLVEELQPGEVRKGRVRSLADFGAFVDLGGADGLIHISELAWGSVGHPSEVLSVGDEVEVLVLSVDRTEKRISLSRKRLQPEPWATVPERYVVGQVVQARVKKLATFGAFVEIEPGVEGLIHISELSDQRIQHPKNVVNEGDAVSAKIIRIEPERRRLGLSLRQAIEEAEAHDWRSTEMAYGGPAETVGEALDLMTYGGPAETVGEALDLMDQLELLPDPDEEEAAPLMRDGAEPAALETEPEAVETEPAAVETEPEAVETEPEALEPQPDLRKAD
jgi:small subunit ribosomal protein S1